MLLEKSLLAANGHTMPMKRKAVIHSASDVQYISVIEHAVYSFDSRKARTNILGKNFSAKFSEFKNMGNPVLMLTVFLGECVK